MKNLEDIRSRYLRDDLSIQLGGLSANLARIVSFSENPVNWKAVKTLLEESKFFIEWSAPNVLPEIQFQLIELQIQLAVWDYTWPKIYADSAKCKTMAEQAQRWSEYVLEKSGVMIR